MQLSEKESVEKILCNIRTNQKMEIRHVLSDQDYFLLVELKQSSKQFIDKETDSDGKSSEWIGVEKDPRLAKNTLIKIHRKVHLRNV
jgi:hypothetical protein